MSGATVALSSDVLVRHWVDAFNARDLEGMLAPPSPGGALLPAEARRARWLIPTAMTAFRRWFARLTQLRHEHVFVLSDVHGAGDHRVLAVGGLTVAGEFEIAPFCALHRIAGGLIVAAHHYLTDPDMLERLGLIP